MPHFLFHLNSLNFFLLLETYSNDFQKWTKLIVSFASLLIIDNLREMREMWSLHVHILMGLLSVNTKRFSRNLRCVAKKGEENYQLKLFIIKKKKKKIKFYNFLIPYLTRSAAYLKFSLRNKSLTLNVKINHPIKLNIFHFEKQSLSFSPTSSLLVWLLILFYSSLGFNDVFMKIFIFSLFIRIEVNNKARDVYLTRFFSF